MDFSSVIGMITRLGMPTLGNALGGPLGGMVADMIGKALKTSPTPEAINDEINKLDPAVAIQKLKSAEAEYIAAVQAEASVAQAQIGQVGGAMRAEIELVRSLGEFMPRWSVGLICFMQASWRPLFAYETLLEMFAGAALVSYALVSGRTEVMRPIMELIPFIQFYLPTKMAVLGVYSWGRTREKQTQAEVPVPVTTGGIVIPTALKKMFK